MRLAVGAGTVVICIATAVSPGLASSDIGRFGVCPDFVEKVEVGKVGREHELAEIMIFLNEKGSKALLGFTKSRVGQRVDVVFDGVVLVQATLQVPIASGKLLISPWHSQEAASRFADLLRGSDSSVPCGTIP